MSAELFAAAIRNIVSEAVRDALKDSPPTSGTAASWRERLWTCPPETRLGITEVCEALGWPKDRVYKHTSARSGRSQLPHRKLDGALVFEAGELREWLREHEEVIVGAPRPLTLTARRIPHRTGT